MRTCLHAKKADGTAKKPRTPPLFLLAIKAAGRRRHTVRGGAGGIFMPKAVRKMHPRQSAREFRADCFIACQTRPDTTSVDEPGTVTYRPVAASCV